MKILTRILATLSVGLAALVAISLASAVHKYGSLAEASKAYAAKAAQNKIVSTQRAEAKRVEEAQRCAASTACRTAEIEEAHQAQLRAARDIQRDLDHERAVWRGLAQDECLAAVEHAAKVQGSVLADTDTWPVARDGKQWVVLATYQAKNAYGVLLRGHAACRLIQRGSGFDLISLKVA